MYRDPISFFWKIEFANVEVVVNNYTVILNWLAFLNFLEYITSVNILKAF